VGKRSGKHSFFQTDINSLLIKKAKDGRTVARLKGGDPFVFGRAGEEITALKENNIPYTVIPGISSAIAAAELAGISVTHRNISRSFHVIAGHTSDDLQPNNFREYARSEGTLVFLMGLNNLRIITEGLMKGGMTGDTPAAIISDCGGENSIVIKGRLDNIFLKAKESNVKSPAVIVVGKTAALDFSPTMKLPLRGFRIAVCATDKICRKLFGLLERMGARVERTAGNVIREIEDNSQFDQALNNISRYSFLVFTSPNGADIFLKRMKKLKIDLRKLSRIKIAAIGSGTAAALENAGLYADIIPEKYTAECLGKCLSKKVKIGERVLILRSAQGSEALTKPFDKEGIYYDDIKIYTAEFCRRYSESTFIDSDYMVFASAGGVRGFFENGYGISPKTKVVCIGAVTAKAAEQYNIFRCLIPCESTAEAMAQLILEDCKNEKIQTIENKHRNEENGTGNRPG